MLVNGNSTEQDNQSWNNFEIRRLMECKPGDERQLRIFPHVGRGKVNEHYQGAMKNS